jgi:hypothetical protein
MRVSHRQGIVGHCQGYFKIVLMEVTSSTDDREPTTDDNFLR